MLDYSTDNHQLFVFKNMIGDLAGIQVLKKEDASRRKGQGVTSDK
jgi:hypothetical protein